MSEYSYVKKNRVGPFVLGEPLKDLSQFFQLVRLESTASDKAAKSAPYSVQVDNAEIALVGSRLGLIESVTVFSSFVVDGTEVIGSSIDVLERLINESPHSPEEFEHDDGSIVTYFDYLDAQLIVTTEDARISSVCLYQ